MNPLEKLEDVLRSCDRVFVGIICLLVSLAFYWTGFLQILTAFLPSIFYLPTIAAIAGLLRLLVERRLGQKKLPSEGKAVFITGCDSGFGNSLSRRLANRGYVVFAGCIDENSEGAASLRDYSKSIKTLQLNVTKEQDLLAVEEEITAHLNRENLQLWAVIANAGVLHETPLELSPMSEIENLINVNLLGVFRTVKALLPAVRKCKGRIIVTSSLSATFAFPYLVSYSVSKTAVKAFCQGLHRELRKFEVTCISIEPTFYRTPLLNRTGPTPADRLQQVDDERKQAYSFFINEYEKLMKGMYKLADTNIEAPINAFEDAVCSARPKRSYVLAPLQYRILTYISSHFDLCFTDLFINALISPWKTILEIVRHQYDRLSSLDASKY
ncbi:17-beta-hydroxysteroid dehydrogenase type 6 [Galendromus occidentalis]|uniref:17-beta-hydroxysteroid dehydrogenase type 6 n=1 Tax=Galendromus occidentalis TaxID=34638 RepID=A0AAJ7L5C4_9ACAR|nr:17-beta-hydroxysteroid dehydrogenase type 6 [Galendromus occidentalis]